MRTIPVIPDASVRCFGISMPKWVPLALGVALCLFALAATATLADTYQIKWQCIGGGGGQVTNGSYRLLGSVGEPAAGTVTNQDTLTWSGFIAEEAQTPDVMPDTRGAKLLANGSYVNIIDRVVTGVFDGFFYVEERDRSNGIRISCPEQNPGVVVGDLVSVVGSVGVMTSGERYVFAPIYFSIRGVAPPVRPVSMSNAAVGGGDLGVPPLGQYGVTGGAGPNNVGLLINICGFVTQVGYQYAMVDDNSGVPVRVDTRSVHSPLTVGDYVYATGISTPYYAPPSNRQRCVLPRVGADVHILL